MQRNSVVANIALVCVTLGISLILCELVFRVIYPPTPAGQMQSFEFRHSWTLNSDGFRDADFETKLSHGKPAILLMGDSFTQGMGAEKSDSFSGLLERDLSADGYEIFNLGKIGTGTIDQREILEQFAPRIKPQAVFLFFYWNDVQDCLTRENEGKTNAASPQPVQTPSKPFLPVPSNIKNLLTKSVFYRWVASKGRIVLSRLGIAKLDFNTELDFFDKLGRNPQVAKGWSIVEQEILRMKEICAELGSDLIVVNIPKREQFSGWDKILKFYHANESEYSLFCPTKNYWRSAEKTKFL